MKIVIFSNNAISYSNSNGRTMLNMLGCFESDNILNICLHNDKPAFNSSKFYWINERKLLNPLNTKYGCYLNPCIDDSIESHKKTSRRTSFRIFIRSLLWNNALLDRELKQVINEFRPDVFVIQCGDSDFLIKKVIKFSKIFSIPILSYNSEDYLFKEWNWIEPSKNRNVFFKMYFKKLERSYAKLYKIGKSFIYLTASLCDLYLKKFPAQNHFVIYNSSCLTFHEKNRNEDIVYLGNIGVGRCDTLINLAELIYGITNLRIKIYTLSKNKVDLDKLAESKFVDLCGGITYEKNIEILQTSKLILHVESFDSFYLKDTKNAFTTKLADCLATRSPLFVLCPNESFLSEYIKKHDCAFIANSLDECNVVLQKILRDKNLISSKSLKQEKTYLLNHCSRKNSELFEKIIKDCIK